MRRNKLVKPDDWIVLFDELLHALALGVVVGPIEAKGHEVRHKSDRVRREAVRRPHRVDPVCRHFETIF